MEYDLVLLDNELTNGLGNIKLSQPDGTFKLTPASYILIKAIVNNKNFLKGIGIDWGSGIGCMAILAAKINEVKKIYGLEISKDNLNISKKNALENSVNNKTIFILADSYMTLSREDDNFNRNVLVILILYWQIHLSVKEMMGLDIEEKF
ncbi:MAG: methyltransferase [Clostridiales bacterium]